MTNIELRFLESAIRFFRKDGNCQNTNLEQRRFIAATLILAGMCSSSPTVSSHKVDNAVWLAGKLLEALSKSE